MPFVLGQKKTSELLFTGDSIDAAEALRVGLVNRVVAPEALTEAVEELVAKIAPTPLETLRLTKTALTQAYEAMGLRAAVAANLEVSVVLNSLDSPERVRQRRLRGGPSRSPRLAGRPLPRRRARRRRARYELERAQGSRCAGNPSARRSTPRSSSSSFTTMGDWAEPP